VPLPDTDGSLKEIEYALDALHANGVGFISSYDDKYLGDRAFTGVFDELNRRKATVYCHPTVANCCWNMVPDTPVSAEEFAFDTTRTVTSLLYSGTFSRCPDVKFIFSHGGGTLPFLAGRICMFADLNKELAARLPHGSDYELKKLHFDTASVTNAPAIAAILKLIPITQLMFGSDFPWGRARTCLKELRNLGLSEPDLRSIESESAIRVFPRLEA
jgi:predicted TIM-barrel fold metal-dependent hydrolase